MEINAMQCRVLVIGDPHFKVNNIMETDIMTKNICDTAEKLKPDMIVCLGDILDRHETIHVLPLTRSTHFLKKLSEISKLYVIIGNHDRPNNSNFLTDEHPFNALKHWNNTIVIDKVMSDKHNGHKFIFVPYVPPGRFDEALETIPDNKNDVTAIFAHQEFYGAKMGAIVSQNGDKWPLSNPLVISGHIHDYDQLQSNIYYVGTPLQHAFGDKSDKTISLFTFESPYNYNHERIDLDLPKKTIVYITPAEVVTYKPPENKLIKLVIRGTQAEFKTLSKVSHIRDLKKMGIKICYKQIGEGEEADSSDVSNIRKKLTYLERLREVISEDKNQVKWYEKLFGSLQKPQVSVIN